MIPKSIADEIFAELKVSRKKWGQHFDEKNTPSNWLAYILHYAGKGFTYNKDPFTFRRAMIVVAALAIAAIETIDRKGLANEHWQEK